MVPADFPGIGYQEPLVICFGLVLKICGGGEHGEGGQASLEFLLPEKPPPTIGIGGFAYGLVCKKDFVGVK